VPAQHATQGAGGAEAIGVGDVAEALAWLRAQPTPAGRVADARSHPASRR
jgi:hypothetical protein